MAAISADMELFQPNNLSKSKPEFDPVPDSVFRAKVAGALGRSYDLADWSLLTLSHVRGVNLLSQNFLVQVKSDRYFLKWRSADQYERLAAETQLTAQLAALKLKVPRVIPSRSGAYLGLTENSCFALYAFEEGEYFTGSNGEIDSAAETFGELTLKAQQLFKDSRFIPEVKGHSFLNRIPSLLTDGMRSDHPVVSVMIRNHHEYIDQQASHVESQRSIIESQTLTMHLDYHPLNLLMRDGKVICVLDFEHMKTYPVLAGLGFAGYKLIRQVMVDPRVRETEFAGPTLLSRWLKSWRISFSELDFSAGELALGARYYVLFLIHFILEKALKHGEHGSTYDLEKQIFSLYEIDQIVGSC